MSFKIPITDAVFLRDAYQQSTTCRVVHVDTDAGDVALDRTVCYPGGGGQPADAGVLVRLSDDLSWHITGAKREGAVILHLLQVGDRLPELGDELRCQVNWEQRYRMMRTHTAMHVLCAVVFQEFQAQVTGGSMAIDRSRMDFELEDLSPARVAWIEQRANEEIMAERDVNTAVLPRAEALMIPDLIRTKINLLPEGIEEIRTVEIVGLDLQADGGTHVYNTREIGGIRVVGTRSKGKNNKRIEIELVDVPEGKTW